MNMQIVCLLAIGVAAGVSSGLFGIGGGVIIVPALVYFSGFSQHVATGTSLAVLLPPVGLAAAFEYYRQGNVNLRAALFIAAGLFAGAWLGAFLANRIGGAQLRFIFGVFVVIMGVYLIYNSLRQMSVI
ncbi:MAG: sulfite exporter TauE/SafE family protein [Elusimicrobia bacterium]|nr:sulfite exporter TauE/SafE family protein [Elusimicrobiota bacterium]